MRLLLPAIYANNGQSTLSCEMEPLAADFVRWWMRYLGDRAKIMVCEPELIAAAQKHAEWLAQHHQWGTSMHVGENGSTANWRARKEGYRIPGWHGNGNTGESAMLSGGDFPEQMPEMVAAFMASPDHHDHLWGIDFWEPATHYGVGQRGIYFIVMAYPSEEA